MWDVHRRTNEFATTFGNCLGFVPGPVTRVYWATVDYWPYMVLLGWLALIPAMFGRPWCAKLRRLLVWCYLILGIAFHLVCLEGQYPYAMQVFRAQARTIERLRHSPPPQYPACAPGPASVQ